MEQQREAGTITPLYVLERADFNRFLDVLAGDGFTLIGPTLRDAAIVYDEVRRDSDFPIGLTDNQEGGQYRVSELGFPALFSYAVGPRSIKNYFYPSHSLLCRARGSRADFDVEGPVPASQRYAFIGVRSCDLHAMAIQDAVFLGSGHQDSTYRALREKAFIVAVNCGHPGKTCFCLSMGTGPKVEKHFDLALTEVYAEGRHYFTIEVGSAQGQAVLEQIPHRESALVDQEAAEGVVQAARGMMGRAMNTDGIRELLYRNANSPRWEETANRCLSCANCTMVCPTCFCSTVEDTTDLSGNIAERWRVWDSCFTMDFSHIHGGAVRKSGSSRYRHWITHKLASWHDQFETSGCVGCGRCITWCPVGIDITEEVAVLRRSEPETGSR